MSRQLTEFFTPTSQGQGKGRSVEQSEQWQRLSVRFATLYGCGSWHPETVAALTSEIAVTKTEVVTELGTSREAPKGDTGTRSEQVLLHRPRLSGTTSELRSGSGGSFRIPVRASGEHSEEGPPAPPSGPLGGTRHLLHARTCTRLNAFFGVACSLCLGVLFLVPAPSAARGSTSFSETVL